MTIRVAVTRLAAVCSLSLLIPLGVLAQGETTSAIGGDVHDPVNAAVPNARVTITSQETGLKRETTTDGAGRFNFPQLTPGTYSVSVEAAGFEPQQNDAVRPAWARSRSQFHSNARSAKQIEVHGEVPLVNPENANTSTTLDAHALENLPNPGGDLTYPLQFAAGALINTAGSGNDFVGGTNGYGNVEFNGLPALSNGYIVDGPGNERSADQPE